MTYEIDKPSRSQALFIRYLIGTLIDLTVLNLFVEYWQHVVVSSFTVSIFAALLLQVLLKGTMAVEQRVAAYFKSKSGQGAKFLRIFGIWLVLFGSKFVILGAVDFVFGERVEFTGPLQGFLSFIVVVVCMLAAEEAAVRLYAWLGRRS